RSLSNPTLPIDSYTLSLHDALPILLNLTDIKFYVLKIVTRNTTNSYPMKIIAEFAQEYRGKMVRYQKNMRYTDLAQWSLKSVYRDRKSTRLNSSHVSISYAVFCLKK